VKLLIPVEVGRGNVPVQDLEVELGVRMISCVLGLARQESVEVLGLPNVRF
jgi:hypothetical protein